MQAPCIHSISSMAMAHTVIMIGEEIVLFSLEECGHLELCIVHIIIIMTIPVCLHAWLIIISSQLVSYQVQFPETSGAC